MRQKEKPTFPKYACTGCGEQFQLRYDPKGNIDKLIEQICPHCHEHAYWSHWCEAWELTKYIQLSEF